MIGFYNYTVILTYFSLLVSSLGLCLAISERPYEALFCLVASGVCDMFDGKIARTRKKSSEEERRFGIQIDSLCDIVCFGVLPAVIGVALTEEGTVARLVAVGVGCALILCALIRLAYFNVTEETRQATETGRRTHYEGLPVTSAAVVFPFAYLMSLVLPAALAPWAYPAFGIACAVCFIAPFKMRKPHGVGLVTLSLIGIGEVVGMVLLHKG